MAVRQSLLRSGSELTPPLGRIAAGASVRTITTNNQQIQLSDSYVFIDATAGARNLTLPDAVRYLGELRVIARNQNANLTTLLAQSGQTINGPDLPALASTTLGPLASGAAFAVIALTPDGNGNWVFTGGSRNQTLAIPYGPFSQMPAAAGAGDGSLFEAVDALVGAGALYQNQRILGVKTWVALAAGPLFPVVTLLPTVSKVTVGGTTTLTATPGAWSDPAATLTYQWKRNGANVGGATATSYVLTSPDYGQPMTAVVTATNSHGSSSAESTPITSSLIATLSAAQPIALLTSAGGASSGALALTAGAAAPSGPADGAIKYLKFPASIPAQVTEDPAIAFIIENLSIQTPVQPWLVNNDGTLFGAASSTIVGGLTMPGASSVTVNAPAVPFKTGGGQVWVPGIGYIEYQAYNASTHVLSGLDSRWAGTVSAGAAIYDAILPRVEPGNTGTVQGATSWGVKNFEVPGVPTASLKVAVQNLTVVEAGGFSMGILAWMV